MNEEAILHAYNLFIKDGYGGNIDHFRELMRSNEDAKSHAYNLFVKDGYGGDERQFYRLIGGAPEGPTPMTGPAASLAGEPVKKKEQQEVPLWLQQRQEQPKEEKLSPFLESIASERSSEFLIPQINPPIPSAPPDKLTEYIDKFPTEIVDMDEGDAVTKLNYLYGDLGFQFNEAIPGVDAVEVTAPDGTKQTFGWDSFTESGDREIAQEFKSFIKQKSKVDSNVDRVNKFYSGEINKIVNQKDADERIKSLATEQDDINNFIKRYNLESKAIQDRIAKLSTRPVELQDALYQSEIQKLTSQYDALQKEKTNYESRIGNFDREKAKLEQAVGSYVDNQGQIGSFSRALGHGYLTGAGKVISGSVQLFEDIFVTPFLDARSAVDAKERFAAAAAKLGLKETTEKEVLAKYGQDKVDEIYNKANDEFKKEIKYGYGALEMARTAPLKIYGTGNISEEYLEKFKEGFWGGSFYGVASSLPALLSTSGISAGRTLKFAAQGLDFATEEMEQNPELKNLSENEKNLIKAPIAITAAILEEYGVRNVVASKGLLNGIVARALGKSAAKGTSRSFAEFVKQDVESMAARGLLKATSGAAAEFETGALQQLTEVGIKDIYNEIKGKEMFKDLPETAVDYFKDVMYAGAQEAVGGFVLGVPGAVGSAYRKQGFEGLSDGEFQAFEEMVNDDKIESAYITKLKGLVNVGDISLAEAKEQLNDYRNARGIYNQVPSELTIENKKKAMNLLRKRGQLEKSIEGKDPALIKNQQAQITEINNQLEELSKPENNAVQEQTTSEVPIQPEARVGEEVAKGEPQAEPQVTAKESQIAEIERRRQEEFDRKSPGNSIIAADYLFTGGRDVMLSTDYLLQALTGAYPAATKALNNIRSKYGSKIGNIKDDIGGEVYNSMMEEIREAIKENYTNPKAEEIFNKILENATGFTYREGNAISSELEKINEENDKQINAKYDAELSALEQAEPEVTAEESVQEEVAKPKSFFDWVGGLSKKEEVTEEVSTPIESVTKEEVDAVITPEEQEALDQEVKDLEAVLGFEPTETAPTISEEKKQEVVENINKLRELEKEKNKDNLDEQYAIGSEQTVGERIDEKYDKQLDLFEQLSSPTPAAAPAAAVEEAAPVFEPKTTKEPKPTFLQTIKEKIKELGTPKMGLQVNITPATERVVGKGKKSTKRIVDLTDKYNKLYDKFTNAKDEAEAAPMTAELENLQSQILDGVRKDIIERVGKMKGVSVRFDDNFTGRWDGKYEPSFNMKLFIKADADVNAVNEMLYDIAEEYSQDAFIVTTTDPSSRERIKQKDSVKLPLSQNISELSQLSPVINIDFKEPLSLQTIGKLAKALNDAGVGYSLNRNTLSVGFFPYLEKEQQNLPLEEQEKIKEETYLKEKEAYEKAIESVFGERPTYGEEGTKPNEQFTADFSIKRSSYVSATNANDKVDPTRVYDRRNILEEYRKEIGPLDKVRKVFAALRKKQIDGEKLTPDQENWLTTMSDRLHPILASTFDSAKELYLDAKEEVEKIAGKSMQGMNAFISTFPIKRPSRASVKTLNWYGASAEKLGDGARVNIIVDNEQDANALFDKIDKDNPAGRDKDLRRINDPTELGYPKRLLEVRTSNGVIAEMQVMTNEGYLAKDGVKQFPESKKSKARKVLKNVQSALGFKIPDGLGHYFYEIHRDTNVQEDLRAEALRLSNLYYDAFINTDKSKLSNPTEAKKFMNDLVAFKNKVNSAVKTSWDNGNDGKAPDSIKNLNSKSVLKYTFGPTVAPTTEPVSKKGMTSEEIEAKKKEIAEENRKAKENAGQNIKVKDYKTTKKRGQDLKIGDVYVRRVGDELMVFKVLSELKKYRGQFYTMDVEILHIGNHVNRKEVGPDGVVSEDSIKVGNKFNDQFKNIASTSGKVIFGEVTVLENFEQPSAKAAPAPVKTESKTEDSKFIIDGKEYNLEEAIEKARNSEYSPVWGSRMEYSGDNAQAKEFVESYNYKNSPYNSKGRLKNSYMQSKVSEAFSNMDFRKFGNLFRKHIYEFFSKQSWESSGNKLSGTWQEQASYMIGDGSYDITEEQFRAFAKDAGIEIPAPSPTKAAPAPSTTTAKTLNDLKFEYKVKIQKVKDDKSMSESQKEDAINRLKTEFNVLKNTFEAKVKEAKPVEKKETLKYEYEPDFDDPIQERIHESNMDLLSKTIEKNKIQIGAEPMITIIKGKVLVEYNNFDKFNTATKIIFSQDANGKWSNKGIKIERKAIPIRDTVFFQNYINPQFRAEEVSITQEVEGVPPSLTLSGNEEVIKGENMPTVSLGENRFNEDYSFEDMMGRTYGRTAAEVGLAEKLAKGEMEVVEEDNETKEKYKVKVRLPYINKSAARKIAKLKSQIAAIKGASKEAKSLKNKYTKELNKTVKSVFNDFRIVMGQNILALYDSLTEDFVSRSKEWYVGANRMANSLAKAYNITLEQASGMIAVLSPRTDWFNNVSTAQRTIEVLDKHSNTIVTQEIFDKAIAVNANNKKSQYVPLLKLTYEKYGNISIAEMEAIGVSLEEQSHYLRAIDQALYSNKVVVTSPSGKFIETDKVPIRWASASMISSAMSIYRDGTSENINVNLGNGNKVRNFYNNIADPNSKTPYVTADTHALSVAMNLPVSANVAGDFKLFGGGNNPLYALVKAAYIDAANVAGIMPREMQSVTWEAQRTGVNDKNRTREQKEKNFALVEQLRENEQTPYERATTIISQNRSQDPAWGKSDRVVTQRTSNGIRRELESRANQRASDVSSIRGGQRVFGGGDSAMDSGIASGETNSTEQIATQKVGNDLPKIFQLIGRLQQAFPNVVVSVDSETFNNIMNSPGVRPFVSDGVVVYGVTIDGDIYINPEVHKSESDLFNTSIHEFGHVWQDFLSTTKEGQQILAKGYSLIKEAVGVDPYITKLYNQQLAKFNGNETKALNEVASILIGNKGAEVVNKSISDRIKDWLSDVWSYISSAFKMSSDLTQEDIENMTLDDFIGTALADMLSGKQIAMSDSQLKQLKNPEAAFSTSQDIFDIVTTGRQNGFSDASIKAVLLKRGFKASDIDAVMQVNLNLFDKLPPQFANVAGGVNVGIDLYNQTLNKLIEFQKAYGYKSMADIRQKGMELLQANPIFQQQTDQIQKELTVAFDKALNTKANKNVSAMIAAIKNDLRQRKIGADNLREAQIALRTFIRNVLPKSKQYSQADINKLTKLVANTTVDNFRAQAEDIIAIAEKQQEKIRKGLLRDIYKLVMSKAQTAKTSTGKRRSKGLDAQGQLFFEAAKKVLKAVYDNDANAIAQIAAELSEENEVDLIIAKSLSGQDLTTQEQRLYDLATAFDSFSDLMNMDSDQLVEVLDALKDERKQSIVRLKQSRQARAAVYKAIIKEADKVVQEMHPVLFTTETNEEGETVVKAKGTNELTADKDRIWQYFNQLKFWEATKRFAERWQYDSLPKIFGFFRSTTANIEFFTNLYDKTGNFFRKNIYDKLNQMNESYLKGYFKEMDNLDILANSISGITKGYKQIRQMLEIGYHEFKVKGTDMVFDGDKLLRIYSLSKNDIQREKLRKMGFGDAEMQRVADLLPQEAREFADKVVQYFSTSYYESVNSVYSSLNDVNLQYLPNYFPTITESQSLDDKQLLDGNFSGIFDAENAPALKGRYDISGDVILTVDFTSVLETHFQMMEKYKAYASGVKVMNALFQSEGFNVMMKETGTKALFKNLVNFSINPNAGPKVPASLLDKLYSKYAGFALAYKVIQLPKQLTAFVFAYQNYQFLKDRKTPGLDAIMFMVDNAKVIATMAFQFKKAKDISATFRDRVAKGIEGDVFGLEAGTRTFKPTAQKNTLLGKFLRGFKTAGAAPTIGGDLLSVMSYMAVYNRNIANGMSPEEALLEFNNFNATLQTRRGTEKSTIQTSQNAMVRAFSMFGSTAFLQLNGAAIAMQNMSRAFQNKEFPAAGDIRRFVISVGLANFLFTFVANFAKLTSGDEEDEEETKRALQDALIGLNLLYQIPILGAGVEQLVAYARGERKPIEGMVNPIASVSRKIKKGIEGGDWINALQPVAEIGIGAQVDPFVALGKSVAGDFDENTMYDLMGISQSYRPSQPTKTELKEQEKSEEDIKDIEQFGMTKEELKKSNPDMYKIYFPEDVEFNGKKEKRLSPPSGYITPSERDGKKSKSKSTNKGGYLTPSER